ncbi:MAG: hypothetical protein COV44_02795 [Deltaproteobacteria bacterium CG11_big_fil_rev_8_21_14_0_20_45_16]|nr:MAG: hypothetical protein COV44_02795 [Deltaproteobacteria bacterium CG11_big_fil_rev_8_21_14_0_20_45_16]
MKLEFLIRLSDAKKRAEKGLSASTTVVSSRTAGRSFQNPRARSSDQVELSSQATASKTERLILARDQNQSQMKDLQEGGQNFRGEPVSLVEALGRAPKHFDQMIHEIANNPRALNSAQGNVERRLAYNLLKN